MNPEAEKDTSQLIIKVPPEEVVFLDQLFKSYEGLAMVTVSKAEKGVIYLDVTTGTRDDVLEILARLKQEINLSLLEI
ncbi:MAG: DUF4911 domain-containing protein [Halanaerobiales bacterium]|nr:DUF4911 domain-containing protein [Halanaerobiales bacterium]